MRIICEFCGGYLEDTDVNCPNCNAPNKHLKRSANGIPKTIEELKEYASERDIPLSQMRFFIGYDMREPKAYGIYRDEEGNFIVYKNKSNGSRSVRYKGSDEAYAVNEIYQKLRTEMAELKMAYAEDTNHTDDAYNPRRYLSRNAGKMSFIPVMIIFVVAIMIIVTVMLLFSNVSSKFQDTYEEKRWNYTYYNNGSWSDGVWEQDDSWDDDYYDNSYDYDDWADDWDGDDWDFDSDWNDSYSDWDSDW